MNQPNYYRYWGKARPEEGQRVPYHLLPYHCLDVAAVGWVLWSRMPRWGRLLSRYLCLPESEARLLVCFLLAIHDLGKFSPHFQAMCPDAVRSLQGESALPKNRIPHRHDSLGFELARARLPKKLAEWGWAEPDAGTLGYVFQCDLQPLFGAVTGHHGRFPRVPSTVNLGGWFGPDHEDAALAFAGSCGGRFRPDLSGWASRESLEQPFQRGSHVLAGYAVLCDWLGSNQRFFQYESVPRDLDDYWKDACRCAEQALDACNLVPPPVRVPTHPMAELFPGFDPTRLQSLAESWPLSAEAGPYLFVGEDLTGSGKTEAALVLAQRLMALGLADGLFFALPTMATADQMYDRLAKAYRRLYRGDAGQGPCLVLAHGQRDLAKGFKDSIGMENPGKADIGDEAETAGAMCSKWLSDNNKKALLGAVGVGTVDQAMLAVLRAKHGSLRLLGLTGKILILDEIHAYDVYMLDILKKVILFHTAFGGSTILLSATLPLEMRAQLIDAFYEGAGVRAPDMECGTGAYPVLAGFSAVGNARFESWPVPRGAGRTVGVRLVETSPAAWIPEQAAQGRCVCWVRNTVHDAMAAYTELARHLGPERITLFHARFAMGDRLRIQEEVLKRFGPKSGGASRGGHVVIATQVVEQSLDLDFDVMVSDLAPIDLLVQRMGRLQRHCRDAQGRVVATGGGARPQDARGIPELVVYTPPFTETPDGEWYAQTFLKANHVYEATLQLWLTHRLLRDKPEIRLPEDARRIIETVYAPEPETIPTGLEESDINRMVQENTDRTKARLNAMSLETGYEDTQRATSEEEIRTRLGIESRILRLARWAGGCLRPMAEAYEDWRYSQVRVAHYLVDRSELPEEARPELERLENELPDRNKGVLFLAFRAEGAGWKCRAFAGEKPVSLNYDPRRGLTIEEES